jgi:hypothetical protein
VNGFVDGVHEHAGLHHVVGPCAYVPADAVDVPGMSFPQIGVLLVRANPVFRACNTHSHIIGRSWPNAVL